MTNWVKQSTSVVISFGPFLDKTDGVTEETGLVSALDHGTTGIKLSKNGGALTIRHATVTTTTYDAYGMYRVTLDTTDTNTLGTLRVAFNEAATCLPVWQDFMVLPANVYDSLVGGSDKLDVNVAEIETGTPSTVIENAIWNADPANHDTGGTYGEFLGMGGGASGFSASGWIAGAIWEEARVDHVAAGSFGEGVPVNGGVTVSAIGNNVVTAAALDSTAGNEIADALLDRTNGIDIGLTPRHALELAAASVLQKLTGAGTGTERVRNFADTADLATVTVDGAGNKSAIIYDFSI